jgi:hypothetical protein
MRRCLSFTVCLMIVAAALGSAHAAGRRTSIGSGADQITVVVLSGTPYEMGQTYGQLMAPEIKATLASYISAVRAQAGPLASDAALDQAWETVKPYVNQRFVEEMRGLADGAGVDYDLVRREHCLSLLMPYACSGIAVWGGASANGHLYQIRNLDFGTDLGLQQYPVISVYLPQTGVAHANVGFAGYVGSMAGMNAEGIALTEKGATPQNEMPYALEGIPFFVLFRDILQDARSLSEATKMIQGAKRHKKYYYVVGDGDDLKAVKIRAFAPGLDIWTDNDPKDELMPKVMQNAVYVTMNNDACWADLHKNYGKYDAQKMIELSRMVHGGSNLMDVVYDATSREMWVAYAEGSQGAYEREYVHFKLSDYLSPEPQK